ncbi:hypothetical protein AG1IA_10223 [Rhizoctonia solani AG-1 IA]|uniref:Uncharacterized protein n=1 Tax=Thanatephorus cucumeris (strain AG1-IA) TaxID=983506 RepID=L8WGA4_THACA|nr:hypothetical protein AG1IA_10223 [Rhizoctonia solani AG-1 IA]
MTPSRHFYTPYVSAHHRIKFYPSSHEPFALLLQPPPQSHPKLDDATLPRSKEVYSQNSASNRKKDRGAKKRRMCLPRTSYVLGRLRPDWERWT